MARKAFYSFHFEPDNWRASQVRNMGVVEGNVPVSDNSWEAVKRGGDASIKRWIDGQLDGRTCVIVLVGSATAGRKWINYEIQNGWNLGKGVVGIHVHKLKDKNGNQSRIGVNPFAQFTLDVNGVKKPLSTYVKCYNPSPSDSKDVYNFISKNLAAWVEEAILIRKQC
ncbi:MAG TPA: TIR domain-containing protein [Chlorobiota bacterium]|nr:TIR domain-containing protein [Chlorobiota bacterium]